ncbi:hypothetical protein L2E82_48534 [Cichorium intybus]|uniref:Uncharacterized protein n=1 Tax=Cichorium intybus TaxID=13427 RepID=A0ACB8YZF4_CICIN|nr:hypothetical protein L2E82_48534 [Cichorium intybus]
MPAIEKYVEEEPNSDSELEEGEFIDSDESEKDHFDLDVDGSEKGDSLEMNDEGHGSRPEVQVEEDGSSDYCLVNVNREFLISGFGCRNDKNMALDIHERDVINNGDILREFPNNELKLNVMGCLINMKMEKYSNIPDQNTPMNDNFTSSQRWATSNKANKKERMSVKFIERISVKFIDIMRDSKHKKGKRKCTKDAEGKGMSDYVIIYCSSLSGCSIMAEVYKTVELGKAIGSQM